MSDEPTTQALQARRDAILHLLATSTFTDAQLKEISMELADLSRVLGPDLEDMADAKLYPGLNDIQTLSAKLRDAANLDNLTESSSRLDALIKYERRRWHPKMEDDHGNQP